MAPNSPNSQDLATLIKNIENQAVLVIGDIMLDRFIYGAVDRISPESPVPVLNIRREDSMLGGAGNALASLAGLKTKAQILSVIGNDEDGKTLCKAVEALGVDSDGLIIDNARPTTVKSRFLAGHQQLLRADFETKQTLSPETEKEIIAQATAKIPGVKAVLISDYGKGMLTPPVLRAIIEVAKNADVPVIVDPKNKDYTLYSGAAAVTPNKKELSEASGYSDLDTDEKIAQAAESIIEKCDIGCIFATRSQDGMSVIQKDAEPVHLRTAALEVFDVSGAGDVVIATITAALAAGADKIAAASLANIAGGIAVSKVGTTPIRAEELTEALHDDHVQPCAANPEETGAVDRTRQGFICTKAQWEEAFEHVQRWRARGLKVGFTNGCFDILHFGHVSYLNQARGECDRLIVGLNIDASVSALKGPERPVHDEISRATVLSALGSVDMVVLFGGETKDDDQTAIGLLEKLQPDYYVKGGDYEVDDIPETPTVRSYGGEVKVLSVFEGHSTTSSIEKMRSEAA